MTAGDHLPQLYFPKRADFRKWLKSNHDKSQGFWFIFFKKATGKLTLTYDESVEEALCYGWIDSVSRKLDEERHMLLFTPRKKKSPWSRLNKTRIKNLIAEGLMTDIGLAKIEEAKKDGSWTIYDEVEDLIIPDDLKKALDHNQKAKVNFDNFSPSTRKGILWWIKSAKTDTTRNARIEKLVSSAEENINPTAFVRK